MVVRTNAISVGFYLDELVKKVTLGGVGCANSDYRFGCRIIGFYDY